MAFRERVSQVTSVLGVSVIRQAPIKAVTAKLGVMSWSLTSIHCIGFRLKTLTRGGCNERASD
jgi:hypothetical protein